MKLENQVCNCQQAERLEELGVKGKGLFCYCHVNPGGNNHEDSYETILPVGFDLAIPDLATTFICNAWTVAELGEMLPYDQFLSGHHMHDNWCASYYPKGEGDGHRPPQHTEYGDTEAEARAALLIYLLENNLITAARVNARLEKEQGK